jgi:Ca-activated chloride channel family protein
MARGSSLGVGSASSTIRFWSQKMRTEHDFKHSVHISLRPRKVLISLLLSLIVILGSWGTALAQNEQSDVHVVPREQKKDAKPDPTVMPPDVAAEAKAAGVTVDPSLKTHTKPIRKDVDLVLVPVTVTDPMNRLVTGLEKENFFLTDSGQPQEIRHFSSEDAPISLGVIFDISGSMSNKIDKSRDAVVEFFKTANPQDEFFLVAFSEKPEVLADFTTSVEDIQSKLVYAVPKGRTALLDAIYLGMNRMRKAKYEKKALLIISDGGDNHSRYTEGEIKSMVREADVQIYAIGLYDRDFKTPEEREGPQLLTDISDVTGGRTFAIGSPNELADVATKIGIELRNQYVLGYRPSNPARDGKWRKIKVKLNPPKGLPPLHVYAKTGYYAPTE